MKSSTKHWIHGLIGGVISSVSTSILTFLGIAGSDLVGFKIPQLTMGQFGIMCFWFSIVGAALYLKQSPMPPEE